ncbi:MAG: tetratricopeptide repeat protein [Tepidisphaeraceae bacterium]|jgi:predicted O-linked N-acetylglucosamine transferase (SPINDLY family)
MTSATVQQIFESAVRHHQAGRFPEAEKAYRQVLAQQPEHPGALHFLGVIANQLGQSDQAVDLIRRAIALNPNLPDAHCNLGIALKNAGQVDQAIAAFGRAIALRPDFAEAHNNLGNALKNKGLLDEAVAAYRRAIALNSSFAEAYSNLGNALRDKGQFDESVAALRQSIALKPDSAEAHNNLGNSLKDLGQLDEAIVAFDRSIALRSIVPEVHYNLGTALLDKGRLEEAVSALRRAIALKPNYPEAYTNLANVLKDLGQLDEAIAALRQALAIKPDAPEIHGNLIFTLQYHPAYDPATISAELAHWDQLHAAPLRESLLPHENDCSADRRLRIGYVSPDFRNHCQAFFTLPLLRNHDHGAFEVYLYSSVRRADKVTPQIREYADVWREVARQSDEELARIIRQDRIDILVDLTMHMADSRPMLFARKPAPIQIAWLAYPGSTGLSAMDYRLTDPYLDPPGEHDDRYVEKSIRLADTFWCFDPAIDPPEVNPLPALTSGYITFGCLNNFCKATDQTLSLWSSVLKSVPNSRLILLSPQGRHRPRAVAKLGIEPHRVEFIPYQARREYFRTYHRIDLCLDTFPYNGHTTSLDSLWMGVPVISFCGDSVVSRAGFSQSMNLGLADEFVGHTPDDFVRLAVEWATHPTRLAEIRSTLRPRMETSPLMDARRFAVNIESVYRQVWRNWCNDHRVRP